MSKGPWKKKKAEKEEARVLHLELATSPEGEERRESTRQLIDELSLDEPNLRKVIRLMVYDSELALKQYEALGEASTGCEIMRSRKAGVESMILRDRHSAVAENNHDSDGWTEAAELSVEELESPIPSDAPPEFRRCCLNANAKYPVETIYTVHAMLDAGFKKINIAKQMGLSRQIVSQWLSPSSSIGINTPAACDLPGSTISGHWWTFGLEWYQRMCIESPERVPIRNVKLEKGGTE